MHFIKTSAALTILLVFACNTSVFAQDSTLLYRKTLAEPVVFRSPEGQFKIKFPGTPEESQEQFGDGFWGEMHYYAFEGSNRRYMVAWCEPNKKAMRKLKPADIFDAEMAMIEHSLGKVAFKDIDEVEDKKCPGRTFRVELRGAFAYYRLLYSKNRYYKVVLFSNVMKPTDKDIAAFLDSFSVVKS